jgi:hypothetical protein
VIDDAAYIFTLLNLIGLTEGGVLTTGMIGIVAGLSAGIVIKAGK